MHATRTNFTTLEDFLNNFFFKDLVPDSSGIAGMLSSWRQDGVKVFTRTKGGAVYYKTDRKQDDVFTFSSGTESKKGHLGHGVAKNGFSGRRFRNPESEQEMNELGTLLANVPEAVIRNTNTPIKDQVVTQLEKLALIPFSQGTQIPASSSNTSAAAEGETENGQQSRVRRNTIPVDPSQFPGVKTVAAAADASADEPEVANYVMAVGDFLREKCPEQYATLMAQQILSPKSKRVRDGVFVAEALKTVAKIQKTKKTNNSAAAAATIS